MIVFNKKYKYRNNFALSHMNRITKIVATKNIFRFLTSTSPTVSFRFSQSKNHQNQEKLREQKARRQQQIQFRKKLLQEKQIQNIRATVQSTRGNYSPIVLYAKLYRHTFLKLIVLAGLVVVAALYVSVAGIYQDPFTGKKKIVLVNQQFEKSLDKYLRTIILNQLCGAMRVNDPISSNLQQKSNKIEQFILEKSGRAKKIVIIPTQSRILTVLPESIVISKNLLMTADTTFQEDLLNTILLMQALFAKRYHIKDLAFSNISLFIKQKITSSPLSDIKFTSIYSRQYSQHELAETISDMSQKYKISQEQLSRSLDNVMKALEKYKNSENSPFCLANRFRSEKILFETDA